MLTVTTVVAALMPVVGPGQPAPAAQDLACITMNTDRMPLGQRVSPLDSVMFTVDGQPVKVCYSRPSSRGRTMIGGEAVPYDTLWRTGANEPTMIHTSVPLDIAGIEVEPGSYSIYTVPGEAEWQVIVNRSISQWGHESSYTTEVRSKEVARATVPAQQTGEHVEQFTITAEPADGAVINVVLRWERSRVVIPVRQG